MIPTATHFLASPSDLLAAVAAAIVESEVRSPHIAAYREWITEKLRHTHQIEPHWRKSLDELRHAPALARLPDPIIATGDAGAMSDLVGAAQLLDIWHMPLVAGGALPKSEEHVQAADRLEDLGRYNLSAEFGILLPAFAGGGPGAVDSDLWHEPLAPIPQNPPGALWPWLDSTTFLPRRVPGQKPDRMGQAGAPAEWRDIEISFARPPPLDITHPHLPDQPRIAVAPLVQTGAEVRFMPTVDGKHYSLVPTYQEGRLREAVRATIEAGAEILLIPEMTVSADHLALLAECLVEEAEDHYHRSGEVSRLAYVLAGVAAPCGGGGRGRGRNFLVMLNGRGKELFRQDKLSHWNIDSWQQRMFGLDQLGFALADPVEEHNEPGNLLNVRDFPGLGRIVNCICSDLDQDLPLDWLILNGRLDWLHAAIMDKSLCWGKSPARPPWPVRRAERAAIGLRGRLVVTNSIGLSDWVSDAGSRLRSPYGRYDAVAVALCLDSQGQHIKQKLIFSEVGETRAAIVKSESWSPERWDRFPKPPFQAPPAPPPGAARPRSR